MKKLVLAVILALAFSVSAAAPAAACIPEDPGINFC